MPPVTKRDKVYYEVHSESRKSIVNSFAKKILSEEEYPEDYLNLLDTYNEHSTTFAVFHKKHLIGSMRLINPEGSCRILDFWNVQFPEDVTISGCREMGSLVIDKRYRGKSRWPILALLDIAYEYSQQHGIKHWFASALPEKFEKFKLMNPSCRVLDQSEPSEHQLKYRTKYAKFFYEYPAPTLFVFDLSGASYTLQFKRVISKKIRIKNSRKKSKAN